MERAAFLDETCAGDDAARAEAAWADLVERLRDADPAYWKAKLADTGPIGSIDDLELLPAVGFSADELRRIEQGQLSLSDDQVNRLLIAYGVASGALIPERSELIEVPERMARPSARARPISSAQVSAAAWSNGRMRVSKPKVSR